MSGSAPELTAAFAGECWEIESRGLDLQAEPGRFGPAMGARALIAAVDAPEG
jgi:hypothetical protein